jgi:UDP-glucuronate 4-epimerase
MAPSQYLVTGAAGFIGSHVCAHLLDRGDEVVGVDNINTYYDPRLKEARIEGLTGRKGFRFERMDLVDREAVSALFARFKPDIVIHLAAQPGVRYSLENPFAYTDANITGTLTILEGCRHHGVRHLVYASSSSVYGNNRKIPFSVADNVDHPVSLYAATKKANELMAHTYSHLFRIPTTGLRFFTVYGPWGRPDMAYFLFTRAILEGRSIDVFNNGKMRRDFTYVDDIVEGVLRVADRPPTASPRGEGTESDAPYKLYNIGNNRPIELLDMIETLERILGKTAQKRLLPMQPGDVFETYADIDDLERDVGFRPSTSLANGLEQFVRWYRGYYR